MDEPALWQYLLLDWAIWVSACLIGFAIVAAVVGHFPVPPLHAVGRYMPLHRTGVG